MLVKKVQSRAVFAVLGGALILALAGAAHAQPATAKCESGKEKCLSGVVTGLLGCYSKDSKKPDPIKFPACIAKVNDKHTGGADPTKGCFAKVEAKPPCLTTEDSDSILTQAGQTGAPAEIRHLLDPAAPPSTLSKCTAGQLTCVAKLAKAILSCDGKNTGKPDAAALTACLQKAADKFTGGADPTKGCFAKLEAKVANDCVTTEQSGATQTLANSRLSRLVPLLTCGDGTIGYGEQCDDSNRVGGDGCSAICTTEVCGNGITDVGETCDDGNTVPYDGCPANCIEQTCTPDTSTTFTATVGWNAPLSVGGLIVVVDYPEDKVSLPGTGGSIPMGTVFSFPTGTSHAENDLGNQGYALRELVSKPSAIIPRPGTLFRINFSNCQGATPPTAGNFSCIVESATAPDGITPVAGATCTVSLP